MKEGLNKETLRRLYVKEGKSASTIAKMFGCSQPTIIYRCWKYGISLRTYTREKKIKGLNKKVLEKLYVKERKSTLKIAKMFGCTHKTVQMRCKEYGIKLRPRMRVIKGLNKSTLQRLYAK